MPRSALAVSIAALFCLGAVPALAGESHSAGVAGGPVYVRMAPFTVTVIGPTNRAEKDVSVQFDLELEAGKTEQNFDPYRRNVVDAFIVAMTGLYDDDYAGASVPVDVLKERMLETVTTVAGPGLVHQVLLIGIGERRGRL